MSPAAIILLALLIACAASALAIARGWRLHMQPYYRPVALLLTWAVIADVARLAIVPALRSPVPYGWPERAAFFADTALVLAWPFALLAATQAVFVRRSPWAAAVAWAACTAALCAAYPTLRQRPLLLTEAAIASACWLASAWAVRSAVKARVVWIASHMALVPILGAQLGVIVSVMWSEDQERDWTAARVVYGAGFVLLLAYQMRQIRKYRARAR